ncbi:MAG TPA: hypothetical protein VGD80_07935 [Kofleriaceae bacterium]
MQDNKVRVESANNNETPVREPLFRRYQIKVKAGVRAGSVPTGNPPLGF